MHGREGSAIWASLAGTAVLATAGALVLAAATYPLAYARRVKQLLEGADSRHREKCDGRRDTKHDACDATEVGAGTGGSITSSARRCCVCRGYGST